MGHADLLEAVWAAVAPGTAPERFPARRDWLLERVAPGERVLDLGCGEGAFAMALREHGAQVVAVDVVAEPVRRARAAGVDARTVALDGPLAFDDGAFDVVWAGEVVEHVVDVQGWLSEVRRVLPSGGRLLLTTPDLDAAPLADPAARDEHFDPRSDHVRFLSPRTLRGVVEAAGFEDVAIDARDDGGLHLEAVRARF